jgi:hypothetical protein
MNASLGVSLLLCLAQEPAAKQGNVADASARSVDAEIAAEARAILGAVDAWAAAQKGLAAHDRGGGRLRVWSDFPARQAEEAADRTRTLLERLDRALGAPDQPEDARVSAVLIRDARRYAELCELIARTAPRHEAFMQQSRSGTGFTLYAPPLTVQFHDGSVQEEALPDRTLAHAVSHLETWRRFGALPTWLTEGIACSGEDGAWGEVWANWYREGFVARSSHADWRGKPTQKIVAGLTDLRGLFAYAARPYEENGARLAFAFAVHGLEAEPERFAAFLKALQAAYQSSNPQGGRPALTPEQVEGLLHAAFGEDFLARFQAWWKKPPKWNAKRR